ncbi:MULTISPECIES: hypothetical protein [unclassified Haematobacter]|nr:MULTISPECIES: hypothetical protein [unclassified Haematobacter]
MVVLSGAGRNFMAGGHLQDFAAAEDAPAVIDATISRYMPG